MNRRAIALVLVLWGAAWPRPTPAAQVTLAPIKDATLFEEGALSNGAGSFLFAGATAAQNSGAVRRALLAFDVAGSVPAGATITGARLTLTVTMSVAGPQPMTLHRLLADWGEGTANAPNAEGMGAPAVVGGATWVERVFDDQPWSSAGGDFVADASASATVANTGTASWTSEIVAADVQAWLDDPSLDFGWILIGNESSETTAKRFGSRELPQAGNRPRLVVDYELNAPTCTGDCDASGDVGINELIVGVNITLGATAIDACPSFDADSSGDVAINELIAAVGNALDGCA